MRRVWRACRVGLLGAACGLVIQGIDYDPVLTGLVAWIGIWLLLIIALDPPPEPKPTPPADAEPPGDPFVAEIAAAADQIADTNEHKLAAVVRQMKYRR